MIDKPLMVLVVAARVRLPPVVKTLAFEKKLMLPVDPRVKDWPLVVPKVPVAVRYVALLFAPEIEAVGLPPATFKNPNLAEPVAVAPRSRSSVVILSVIAPFLSSNGDPPFTTGRIPVTSVPPFKLTADEVRTPLASEWISPMP